MNTPLQPHSWRPDSWQSKRASQIPSYRDRQRLDAVLTELARLPPIVTSWEVEALREQIAAAQQGRAFVLQGGDCAEAFDECTSENIVQKLKILLQMSVVIIAGLKRPVVRVGRMAGQYAKPRVWNSRNLKAEIMGRQLKSKYLRIFYEDFVKEPIKVVLGNLGYHKGSTPTRPYPLFISSGS